MTIEQRIASFISAEQEHIISTLERMMQCGVGKCNHCCVGSHYLCRDGPVYSYREIREMWE